LVEQFCILFVMTEKLYLTIAMPTRNFLTDYD
jgi:hypothetical protein